MKAIGYFSIFFSFIIFGCTPDKIEEPPKEISDIIKNNIFDRDTALQNIYTATYQRESQKLLHYFSHPKELYRKIAVRGFASIQDSNYLPQVLQQLRDKKASVREEAAHAIGQMWAHQSQDSLLRIARAMQSDSSFDVKVQQMLHEAIGKSADPTGVNFLAKNLYQNDTMRIGQALGIYRAATKPQPFKKAMTDSGTVAMLDYLTPPKQIYKVRLVASAYFARVGKEALEGLSHIPDAKENIFKVLKKKALDDSQIFVRANATRALSHIQTIDSENILYQILDKEEDYRVKVAAIRALGAFKPSPKIKKAIGKLLVHPNTNVQTTAAQILGSMARTTDSNLYLDWVNQTTNWRARALLLAGLIDDQSEKASQKALSILDTTQNDYEKVALIKALASDYKNISLILDTLRNTKNHLYRTAAAEGLSIAYRNGDLTRSNLEKIKKGIKITMSSQDVGAMAVVAGLIQNKPFRRAYQYDYKFLIDAQKKLELPKNIETYQEIQKAINYIKNKKNTQDVAQKKALTYLPLKWDSISVLSARQKVLVKTNKGEFMLSLFTEEAPMSVYNFVRLAKDGFYDNKFFHRVVPNFVVQTGDPRGDGWGSSNDIIRSEFAYPYYDDEGYIGMASAGKDTESCQFFITHNPTPHLDGRYTIFGKVVSGMSVIHQLEVGDEIIGVDLE